MESEPFRSLLYIGNGERSFSCSADTLPAGRGPLYPAGPFEGPKGVAEAFVLDRQRVAERRSRACFARGQQREHLLAEIPPILVLRLSHHGQMGRLRIGGDKLQIDWRRSRRGAVLAGEHQAMYLSILRTGVCGDFGIV